jgi:hypothetical protein
MTEMKVDQKTIDEFNIGVIDFESQYGYVLGKVICKDCENGRNIVSSVFCDVRGYARICVYCSIHGEWSPSICSSQAGPLKD